MEEFEPLNITVKARIANERDRLMRAAAHNIITNRTSAAIYGGREYEDTDTGEFYNERGVDLQRWGKYNQFSVRHPSYQVALLSFRPGLHSGRMKEKLGANNCTPVVELLPEGWRLPKGVYPTIDIDHHRRCTTIAIPWPEHLRQNEIPLKTILPEKRDMLHRHGHFILGADSMCGIIHIKFDHIWNGETSTGNILAAGQQRSGKSNLTRVIALQLLQGDIAHAAFIDPKGGEGVGKLDGVSNQVLPLALDAQMTRDVLFTLIMEMLRRYRVMREEDLDEYPGKPLAWFFSEFGTYRKDEAIMYQVWRLLAQGPAAKIHGVLDTQSPSSDQFGGFVEAKNQLDRIFVYRTANQHDTTHIIPPGLDLNAYALQRPGDGYMVGRSVGKTRFMTALVEPDEIRKHKTGKSPYALALEAYNAERLHGLDQIEAPKAAGRPVQAFTIEQMLVMSWALQNRATLRQMPGEWRTNVRQLMQDTTGAGISHERLADLRQQAEMMMEQLAIKAQPALEDHQR